MPGKLTSRTVHIDKPLTNLAIGFEASNFIVDQIFPSVSVNKESDLYFKYDKGDFFRLPDSTLRAPKTKGRAIEFSVSSETYFVKNYALREEIAFETLANQDAPLKLERKTVAHLMGLLMLDWETRVASLILTTGNVGSSTTLSGVNQWNNGESNPVEDIETGKDAVISTTGKKANLLILGHQVFTKLIHHPDLLERIKYVQKGVVSKDILATVFDVDRVIVGSAITNTANEGATDAFSFVWGKHALLAHVTNTADPDGKDPSFGYSFRWNNPKLGSAPFAVQRWDDPDGGDYTNVRVQYYQDEKITASELSYLIADAVA